MGQFFIEVSLLIVLATGLGLFLHALKQPLILAYLAAGVIAGPLGLKIISDPELIASLSTFGIAFLLFLVGLELDLKRFRHLGKTVLLVGVGQVMFTTLVGYAIIRAVGISGMAAWYIALALAFSSTIIVVKLLSERRDLDSLAGRIIVTVLLVQDVVAILALITLSALNSGLVPSTSMLLALGKAILLAAALALLTRYALARLFTALTRAPELILLAAASWCLVVALAFGWSGLSIEIGAFLAGLSLATLPFHLEIAARVRGLRDFFVTLFFIALGSQLTLAGLGNLQPLFWGLTAFVIIGNPLIVMLIMRYLGYQRRTSFNVGLTTGMISEFSLILMALGQRLGQVNAEQVALVTAIGVTTISLSSFLLSHMQAAYRLMAPLLKWFERKGTAAEPAKERLTLDRHVVLFGCDRLGEKLAAKVQELGLPLLVIDFNPSVIARLKAQGINHLMGDVADLEALDQAGLERARLTVSTIPDLEDNLLLLSYLRQMKDRAPALLTATTWHDTDALYRAGADYVIFPHYLTAEHVAHVLPDLLNNPASVTTSRAQHLSELTRHYEGWAKL